MHPDAASHLLNQPFTYRQTQSCAAILGVRLVIGLPEPVKDTGMPGFFDTDAGVAHRKLNTTIA